MASVNEGFQIRGNDGLGVFIMFSGKYAVEHFHLAPEHTIIKWRSDECETREQAREIEQQYRSKYGN